MSDNRWLKRDIRIQVQSESEWQELRTIMPSNPRRRYRAILKAFRQTWPDDPAIGSECRFCFYANDLELIDGALVHTWGKQEWPCERNGDVAHEG